MQAYCPISGIRYRIADTFGSKEVICQHPAFSLPIRFHFANAGNWSADKLNAQERKLMFLSLLKATDLVHFKHAAFPSESIVQKHMENALKIVSWILGIRTPTLSLPQFIVTRDTADLGNIKHWLETWWDARKAFEDGYKTQGELAKLRNREYALERLIKNAHKKAEEYAGLLANWSFTAAEVPENLHTYWKDIFLAKGVRVYTLRPVDIDECLEHMEDHLEHGTIYSNAVLKHLRTIKIKNKQGIYFGLGMEDATMSDEQIQKLADQPYRILEGSIEEINQQVIASNAPTESPKETEYPSRVAYLRAKIAWQMAEKARAYADEFTTQVEQSLQDDEEINDILEDDVEDMEDVPDEIDTSANDGAYNANSND